MIKLVTSVATLRTGSEKVRTIFVLIGKLMLLKLARGEVAIILGGALPVVNKKP